MGLAGEWIAYQFLRRRHSEYVDESCWVSENRAYFFGGDEGNDSAGYDFRVTTPQAEWLYEVKSSLEDSGEFELTANELRVAGGASKDGRRRVPHPLRPLCFFTGPLVCTGVTEPHGRDNAQPVYNNRTGLCSVEVRASIRSHFDLRTCCRRCLPSRIAA